MGKDSRTGLVSSVMEYQGVGNSLSYYCKEYTEMVETSALVAANLFTQAIGEVPNYSVLTAYIQVGVNILGQNNTLAATTGGFSASTSIAEFLTAGTHRILICVAGRSLSNWTATFSIGVSK